MEGVGNRRDAVGLLQHAVESAQRCGRENNGGAVLGLLVRLGNERRLPNVPKPRLSRCFSLVSVTIEAP